MARDTHFDLLIVDWILPGKSGIDIIKNLRINFIETPALIITTKNNIQDIVKGLKSGSDGYLCKPFNLLEFKTRVDVLLHRPSHTKMKILRTGPITLNTATTKIKVNGIPCPARKKEYQILKYFMENHNIVLTREQILNNVWAQNDDPYASSVDVHISRIRDKIDKPFGTHYLQTVHGIGYKLTTPDQE